MVYNNFGSQWVIGHVIWFTIILALSGVIGHVIWIITALALTGLLIMLYGSLQLWLSFGYWSCDMFYNSSSSQWIICHVMWFTITLALIGVLVMLYGS